MSELKATPGEWLIRNPDEWTKDIVTYEGDNTLGEPMYWNLGSVNIQRDGADATLHLWRASRDLYEENEQRAKLLGQVYTMLLQGQSQEVIDLIYESEVIDYSSGEPVAVSPALKKARGETE